MANEIEIKKEVDSDDEHDDKYEATVAPQQEIEIKEEIEINDDANCETMHTDRNSLRVIDERDDIITVKLGALESDDERKFMESLSKLHDVNSFLETCPTCGQMFRSRSDALMHAASRNCDSYWERRFLCMYCSLTFETQTDLDDHIGLHQLNRHFCRNECGLSFTTLDKCLNHEYRDHAGKRESRCRVCKLIFLNNARLSRHMRNHKCVQRYVCALCRTQFLTAKELEIHWKQDNAICGLIKYSRNAITKSEILQLSDEESNEHILKRKWPEIDTEHQYSTKRSKSMVLDNEFAPQKTTTIAMSQQNSNTIKEEPIDETIDDSISREVHINLDGDQEIVIKSEPITDFDDHEYDRHNFLGDQENLINANASTSRSTRYDPMITHTKPPAYGEGIERNQIKPRIHLNSIPDIKMLRLPSIKKSTSNVSTIGKKIKSETITTTTNNNIPANIVKQEQVINFIKIESLTNQPKKPTLKVKSYDELKPVNNSLHTTIPTRTVSPTTAIPKLQPIVLPKFDTSQIEQKTRTKHLMPLQTPVESVNLTDKMPKLCQITASKVNTSPTKSVADRLSALSNLNVKLTTSNALASNVQTSAPTTDTKFDASLVKFNLVGSNGLKVLKLPPNTKIVRLPVRISAIPTKAIAATTATTTTVGNPTIAPITIIPGLTASNQQQIIISDIAEKLPFLSFESQVKPSTTIITTPTNNTNNSMMIKNNNNSLTISSAKQKIPPITTTMTETSKQLSSKAETISAISQKSSNAENSTSDDLKTIVANATKRCRNLCIPNETLSYIHNLPESRKLIDAMKNRIKQIIHLPSKTDNRSVGTKQNDEIEEKTSQQQLELKKDDKAAVNIHVDSDKSNADQTGDVKSALQPPTYMLSLTSRYDVQVIKARRAFPMFRFFWICAYCPSLYERKHSLRTHLMRTHQITAEGLDQVKCQVKPIAYKNVNNIDIKTMKMEQCNLNSSKMLEKSKTTSIPAPAIETDDSQSSTHKVETTPVAAALTKTTTESNIEPVSTIASVDGPVRNVAKMSCVNRAPRKYPYLCKTCGRTCTSLTMLNDHIRGNCSREPQYECTVCNKRFFSMSTLTCHLTIHTGELPHKCSYCDKHFRTRGQVKVHHRTHTGERPFQCQVCSLSFTHRETLIAHLSRHIGMKRYKCYGCNKSFSCISGLQTHRDHRQDTCGKVKFNPRAIGPRVRVVRGNVLFEPQPEINPYLRSEDPPDILAEIQNHQQSN